MKFFTSGLIAISVPVLMSFAALELSGTETPEVFCDCGSDKIVKKENKITVSASGQSFSGTCSQQESVYWVSLLKKKKLPATALKVINGRIAYFTYSNGELTSKQSNYLSGTKASFIPYSGVTEKGNALQNGEMTEWYESGSVAYKGNFEKGLPVGIHSFWNGRGLLSEKINVLSSKSYEDVKGFHFECEVTAEKYSYDQNFKPSVTKVKGIWSDENGLVIKEVLSGRPDGPGVIKN